MLPFSVSEQIKKFEHRDPLPKKIGLGRKSKLVSSEVVFGQLEVLHTTFHDRTSSNLEDYVPQTNRQTSIRTDKQTDIAIYVADMWMIYYHVD